MRTRVLAALPASLLLLLAGGCQPITTELGSMSTRLDAPPLFEGMGPHKRAVSTKSPEAQKYFDQGLTWAYAFNHDEAIRSFEHAAKLDPTCAMAWWGVALCHGPHINNPAMTEERSRAAWEALEKARELAPGASEVERALIAALAERYADPSSGKVPLTFEERAGLDKAYADAMAKVWREHDDDADVGNLYAEALMDLRPWDLWDREGNPRPETPAVLATLERVMELDEDHPGANHLYIHACEASKHPEKAVPAADRLRTLVPASGHLVHMPAHIDVRVGEWDQAAEQNRRASKIDGEYRKISPRQGFYRLYMAHNDHFLSWACMMQGRKAEAISAARAMLSKVPKDWLMENAPIADSVAAIEIEALLRFGEWDELLKVQKPPEILPITIALWHFGRASAHNAKGELTEARAEQEAFRKAAAAVPKDAIMAINKAHDVLAIAELVLDGEIRYRDGDADGAVAKLREAARLEDGLMYMEPPDWVQPSRHALGAILLASDRFAEAEEVYRKDLKAWPENGWSLYGLSEALKAQKKPEAASVEARFRKAWADADTEIGASCLCVEKK